MSSIRGSRNEAEKSDSARTGVSTVGARTVEVGEDAGQRIDNFLFRLLKDVPKSRVYKMIR